MSKFKKISISFFIFFVSFGLITVIHAATLGVLSHWESDEDSIGRWTSSPRVYWYAVDGSLQGTLSTYVSHARSQWNNAGVTNGSTSSSSNANISVYGGTYANLKPMAPNLTTENTGRAISSSSNEGSWLFRGSYKNGRRYSQANVFIVYKSYQNGNGYRKTTTHELGHALGWRGHSSNSADIMYGVRSQVTNLTTRDRRHLNQVY